MMTIQVKFFANFCEITGVKEAELPTPKNVRVLLNALVMKFGLKLAKELYNPTTSKLQDFAFVAVNGRPIESLEGLDIPLKDKDVIFIFPPVGGG